MIKEQERERNQEGIGEEKKRRLLENKIKLKKKVK